jgi:hypothetical protein
VALPSRRAGGRRSYSAVHWFQWMRKTKEALHAREQDLPLRAFHG